MSILGKKSGFTLIELLITISILGVLAGASVVVLSGGQAKARDAKRKSDLAQLKTVIETYKTINGSYPSTGGAWVRDFEAPTTYIPNVVPKYVSKLPSDPLSHKAPPTQMVTNSQGACTSNETAYMYRSDGIDFKLIADCTIESPTVTDPLNDPARTMKNGSRGQAGAWAYAVYSDGGASF